MANTTISHVKVEALYNQFDIEIKLKPGLNIFYGKNGTGKTTFLHILANLLELDFDRFAFLEFKRATIVTSNSDIITLEKIDIVDKPEIRLNGVDINLNIADSRENFNRREIIRKVLGARPTYLPAFRSILERIRHDQSPVYSTRSDEANTLAEREFRESMEDLASYEQKISPFQKRLVRDKSYTNADKTINCRKWFGQFVPVIRYPSVADVEAGLSDEWRQAVLEAGDAEQQILGKTFVDILSSLTSSSHNENHDNDAELLSKINALINDPDDQIPLSGHKNAYHQLQLPIFEFNNLPHKLSASQKVIAKAYYDALTTRKKSRKEAFRKCQEFSLSINKFLDNKALTFQSGGRTRYEIGIAGKSGRSFGLSALSSGERQILTMLYCASRAESPNGIFLIDEPEISLHIDWQRIILNEILNSCPERQVIACTHSPEVGADHFDALQTFSQTETRSPATLNFRVDE